MRRRTTHTLLISTLASTLIGTMGASVLLGGPASAMRAPGDVAAPSAARGGQHCDTGIIGVDSEHHIRWDSVVDDRMVKSARTPNALPFDVTALGFYGSKSQGKHEITQLNAIAVDGVPRNITLDATRSSTSAGPDGIRITNVKKYDDRSFSPRLYADNYTYFAYTVNGSIMKRWDLTRYADGAIRYAHASKVGGGFDDLTSLVSSVESKEGGVVSEILYGTTLSGELLQIVVPVDHPNRAKVHRLASSGYAGVTGLSWTVCNAKGKGDLHSLIAIDPVGNHATWTTIKKAFTRPKAALHGEVTGQSDWHLSGVL